MSETKDEVEITITISREAFEKVKCHIAEDHGPGGQFVRLMTPQEYIEWLVETALEN